MDVSTIFGNGDRRKSSGNFQLKPSGPAIRSVGTAAGKAESLEAQPQAHVPTSVRAPGLPFGADWGRRKPEQRPTAAIRADIFFGFWKRPEDLAAIHRTMNPQKR